MSDLESTDWSEIAANNIQPSPNGWPPGSSPNIVYTTDRETMGAIKRDWNRRNAAVTSGGSANAQTLTYTQNPTALVRGQRYAFIAGFQNTGAMTLAVGGLAATAVQVNGAALVGGELKVGLISEVIYDGTQFQLIAGSGAYLPLVGGTLTGHTTVQLSSGQNCLTLRGASGAGTQLILDAPTTAALQVVGETAGSPRWIVQPGNGASESGSNVGSDFVIQRYSDAGAFIDSPLTIARSTGQVNLSNQLNAYGNIYCPNNPVFASGYQCRAGTPGGFSGNNFNINYVSPSAGLWIDATFMGLFAYTSDYRIKRDIQPLPSMWERVKALNPISYRHKDYTPPSAQPKEDGSASNPIIRDDSKERWGFIAHELQEDLIEDAATGTKDQDDCIQSPNPWTVIATLTKALQEAMARIETLEAKAAALPA